MISLPKIIKITGGGSMFESAKFPIDNYEVLGFLFENSGAKLTVKVKASKGNCEAKAVPFLLKASDAAEYEEIGADGKEITGAGAFLAVVTGNALTHGEFDRAAISLTADSGTVATAYALQANPRYSE